MPPTPVERPSDMKLRAREICKVALSCAAFGFGLTAASGTMASCSEPAAANVDWTGCYLTNKNLRDAMLNRAQLNSAVMVFTDLSSANLREASLRKPI